MMNVSIVSRCIPSVANPADWMPRTAEVSLVIAMAWVVSGWFVGGAMPPSPSPMSGGVTSMTMPSVEAVTSVPLFGEPASMAVSPITPVAKSHLAIQLLGTVVAGSHSAAILASRPGAEQKVFLLGQVIEPGVILRAVEPEAVVVDNHGRMERIAMTKPTLSLASVEPAGATRIDIPRASLDAQLQNLPKLLTQARAIPHQARGKPDGIMIDDIVPGSLYAKAGLKNGDVIRRINGRRLTRMDQGIRMFQALKNERGIDIEIARGGAVRHLHYSIQ